MPDTDDRIPIIREFLHWSQTHGYHLVKTTLVEVAYETGPSTQEPVHLFASIEDVLAHYTGADPAKES